MSNHELLKNYTIKQLISCVDREIKMRERVYANRVRAGKMKKETARREYDMMPPEQDELNEL